MISFCCKIWQKKILIKFIFNFSFFFKCCRVQQPNKHEHIGQFVVGLLLIIDLAFAVSLPRYFATERRQQSVESYRHQLHATSDLFATSADSSIRNDQQYWRPGGPGDFIRHATATVNSTIFKLVLQLFNCTHSHSNATATVCLSCPADGGPVLEVHVALSFTTASTSSALPATAGL